MSLLAHATDYGNRSDYDDPELYWSRCAMCDEYMNPDETVTVDGVTTHDYCAESEDNDDDDD